MRVELSREQLYRCYLFAVKNSDHIVENKNMSQRKRSKDEIIHNIFIGKIGELATAIHFKQKYGIETEASFEILPKGKADDHDLLMNGKSIEIKSVKSGSKWLLLEKNRYDFYESLGLVPDAYILAVVGWNGKKVTGRVDLKGYIFSDQFIKKRNIMNRFPENSYTLEAINYGIHELELSTYWNKFVAYLNKPRDQQEVFLFLA